MSDADKRQLIHTACCLVFGYGTGYAVVTVYRFLAERVRRWKERRRIARYFKVEDEK